MTDGYFETPDQVRIHYQDYEPPAAAGTPVLCLHGLTRNERDFEELAPRITALGRRVIVPTQRGRGLSDRDPNVERYTPAVYVADMLALLDFLGVERAVWVGTSMGGLMTMIAAAEAPQRLAGAVLNDVGPEIDPVGLERIRSYAGAAKLATTWDEAAELARQINRVSFPQERDSAFWAKFARRLFREEAPGRIALDYDPETARTVQPQAGPPADLWPLFNALGPIPTLVIRGDITDVLMGSTVDEMRRRKPDLAVASVPDVGHAPFITEPAAWNALSAFLSGRAR